MVIYVQLSQPELIKSRLVTSQRRSWMTSSSSLPDMLNVPRDHRPRDRCLDSPCQRAGYRYHHSNMTSSPSVSISISLPGFQWLISLLLCGVTGLPFTREYYALNPLCLSVCLSLRSSRACALNFTRSSAVAEKPRVAQESLKVTGNGTIAWVWFRIYIPLQLWPYVQPFRHNTRTWQTDGSRAAQGNRFRKPKSGPFWWGC